MLILYQIDCMSSSLGFAETNSCKQSMKGIFFI